MPGPLHRAHLVQVPPRDGGEPLGQHVPVLLPGVYQISSQRNAGVCGGLLRSEAQGHIVPLGPVPQRVPRVSQSNKVENNMRRYYR